MKQTDFVCSRCMTWSHSAPVCDHNAEALCACGSKVSYRFVTNDGTLSDPQRCWRCAGVGR